MEKGSPHTLHLEEDVLELYALGRITDDSHLADVEEHLLVCPTCQAKLDDLDKFIRAFRDAGGAIEAMQDESEQNSKTNPFNWHRPFIPMALAAAVAAVFVVPPMLRNSATPVAVDLVSYRNEPNSSAPSGKPLILKLDLTGIETTNTALAFEVVSATGATIAQGQLQPNEPKLTLSPLASGQYWVRLREIDKTNLIREFSLTVK
jgi:hypothetical protein